MRVCMFDHVVALSHVQGEAYEKRPRSLRRPLRISGQVLERFILSIVRCFCMAQVQKGVADTVIKAKRNILKFPVYAPEGVL